MRKFYLWTLREMHQEYVVISTRVLPFSPTSLSDMTRATYSSFLTSISVSRHPCCRYLLNESVSFVVWPSGNVTYCIHYARRRIADRALVHNKITFNETLMLRWGLYMCSYTVSMSTSQSMQRKTFSNHSILNRRRMFLFLPSAIKAMFLNHCDQNYIFVNNDYFPKLTKLRYLHIYSLFQTLLFFIFKANLVAVLSNVEFGIFMVVIRAILD